MSESRESLCPICGGVLEIKGSSEKCPMCGYSSVIKSAGESVGNADEKIATYRLMASADAFFSKKSYEEAYVGYGAVLDADKGNLKARFRRETASHYLMMESSSVYLSCDSFFEEVREIKKQLIENNDERLSLTVCRDMLNFISARADYEKKYASLHKNEKTAAMYMSDTLLLYEYTVETVISMKEKSGVKNERERAFLVSDGFALGMKLRGMLLSGAEYVETSEKIDDLTGVQSVKNISRIKRRRLSQDDEIQVETLAGNMRKAKNDLMAELPGDIFADIKAAGEKSEKAAAESAADDDKKRIDHEVWRQRNEREYIAADKRILIFGIAEKAAAVMIAIMAVMFFIELIFSDVFMGQLIAIAVFFAAACVLFGVLKKSSIKKKGFYAKVIEGDSANIRSVGKDFKD